MRHDAEERVTGRHVGNYVASGLWKQDMQRGRTDVCQCLLKCASSDKSLHMLNRDPLESKNVWQINT